MDFFNADTDALLIEYAQTKDFRLRDEIIRRNLSLARLIAGKFTGRGVEFDDLFQVASLALVSALERFDPDRGIRFSTFAVPSITGAVRNYFRDHYKLIRTPRNTQQLLKKLDEAAEECSQTLGRVPYVSELAEKMGIGIEELLELHEIKRMSSPVALDKELADEEHDHHDINGSEDAGYTDFENSETLRYALSKLDARERDVIQLRFFEGLTQKEAADRLDVAQMTVSRLERKALSRLRTIIDGGKPN